MSGLGDKATAPRIAPFGDAALVVEFGDTVDRALSAGVLALDARVTAAEIPGLVETMPSFRSLLVVFDPLQTDHPTVEAALAPLLEATEAPARARGLGRTWRLPVCYEPSLGLDLEAVAEETGLSTAAVVDRHVSTAHHVYMLGFLPGCPYLGDLPEALRLPRLKEPRLKVPAGSVAIAAGLTVIYPVESPGGWRVIGRTPAPLFDPASDPPALFAPGDRILFEPVDRAAHDAFVDAAAAGDWRPEPEDAP